MNDRPQIVRSGERRKGTERRAESPAEIKALGRLIGAMLARERWRADTTADAGPRQATAREGSTGVDRNV